MAVKFESSEQVKQERKKLVEKFGGALPGYLDEYLTEKEEALLLNEYYKEKYSQPKQDRIQYGIKKNKEFWENNDVTLAKVLPTLRKDYSPIVEEPVRAGERIEQERELTKDERDALIKICSRDLYLFAIRYFPHYLKRPSSKLHKWLYVTLSREFNKKHRREGMKMAVAAPRGGGKSVIVSTILPLWCIVYNKKRFIIMLSNTISQATDFLTDIKRELEVNAALARDFPYAVGKGQIWRADEIITTNNVKLTALGTGSQIRGRRFGVHRPDVILFDDIESPEMVRSKSQRDFVRYQWFDKDVQFAGAEKGSGSITDFLFVGTILGKESLLNALLDPSQYPDWSGVRFKAVEKFSDSELWDKWAELYQNRFDSKRQETARKFFEEHEEEMLRGVEVLWPEGDPYYDLMIVKLKDPSSFLLEKQNTGIDLSRVLVRQEELHWRNFSAHRETKDAIKRAFRAGLVFGSIDPSLGKKAESGDYSCIVTLCRDPMTGLVFVLDINLKRRKVDDQIDAILAFHQKYRYRIFGVETNAFQYVIADNLRKKSRQLGLYVPIEEIEHYSDKKMRIEGIVPFLKDHTIVFDSYKRDYVQSYSLGIEQLCTFTGEGDSNDDFPDALASAFELAKAPKFKMLTRKVKKTRR